MKSLRPGDIVWSRYLARYACTALPLILVAPASAHADPPSYLDRGLVTEAVRRAVARAGLGSEVTQDLARRARAAGWMPRLTVQMTHGRGTTTTVQTNYFTTDRENIGDSFRLNVGVVFSFDRLLFDPHEVTIARVEMERDQRRHALEREVIDLLATMEQARHVLRTAERTSPEGMRAELEFTRARARLEALTGVTVTDLWRAR